MRAFVALELPTSVRGVLAALQRELAHSCADVKWVEPKQLHVTLKFLGEITDDQRRSIEVLLRDVCACEQPFILGLEKVGAFPTVEAPRVIWVGISKGKEVVMRLAEAIEQKDARIPLHREGRAFAAHVTLGRVRSPRRQPALAQQLRSVHWQPLDVWSVTSVRLYQSILSAAGPQYHVLADVPLGTTAPHDAHQG